MTGAPPPASEPPSESGTPLTLPPQFVVGVGFGATDRLRFVSLVVSGGLAGATGIILASMLGSGSPTAGTPYLLPAFTAAFLGVDDVIVPNFFKQRARRFFHILYTLNF